MSTYTPIASITLASTASSISFIGIPQTYTDLVLVCNFGAASNGFGFSLSFNGDEGTNYSTTSLRGDGSSATSNRITNSNSMYADSNLSANTGITTNSIINIMNYTNTTTNKTVLWRANNTDSSYPGAVATVGLWRNTNAITRVSFSSFSGNLAAGSIFNLYGIANASITNVAKATGGDIITTDGTYWYHGFLSSGVFTPKESLTAEYLVVGGGGSGGNSIGYIEGVGGGGAGGYRSATGVSLTAQNYAVTIGAGGAGITTYGIGNNGSSSSFASFSSAGGGAGNSDGTGGSGGSGGGGGAGSISRPGGLGNFPVTSPSQGNDGGAGAPAVNFDRAGGGGGGASAVGATATTGVGGNGGAGSNAHSTWATATYTGVSGFYAGGGGGATMGSTQGSGGSGGGGAGSKSGNATNGTANTGSGGGGYANNSVTALSGNGGSGIVIVRYAV